MSELPPTSRLKVGMISFGQTNVECTIRAISAFGATLMVPSPTRIPDEFILVAGSGQKSYACNVVKRSGISIGVVFVPLKARHCGEFPVPGRAEGRGFV